MKNVLVFPCGSEVGLEVKRALSPSIHFKLFGASSVDDHGKYVYQNYISGLPFVNHPDFVSALNLIIEKYNIDYIVPAHDAAVIAMAENQPAIPATVITSPFTTCKICRSKSATYELFKKIVPTPAVYNSGEEIDFPVFLKPDVGQGSKGSYKVDSGAEVEFYLKKDPSLLVLEYLPGKEYTIDCFTDSKGQLLFAQGRERKRIVNGISVNAQKVDNPQFLEWAEKINQTLTFQGVWFFQVKENHAGELVLLEIAPRIAGTMALFRSTGVNFIQLSLFDRMGFDVSIIHNKIDVEIDRALVSRFSMDMAYENVYIDLDDTIIIEDRVNTEVMKFMYQSKNKQKKIFLITRHKADVKDTLQKFAVSERLFEDIIVLESTQNKCDFISKTQSIFIDDSFSERKMVFDALGIPVFGVDAIEALLDYKS